LHGIGGHLHRHVGGEALAGCGQDTDIPAALRGRCGDVDQVPSRFDLHCHVREHELHALELPDRLTELLTFLDITDRRIECALRDADRLSADRRPGLVQGLQRGLEAGPGLTDDPVGRNGAVGEVDLAGR